MSDETLAAEEEFLLRSIDDLEAELAAGGIDAATYRTLHDDYTARAAAVIRARQGRADPAPQSGDETWGPSGP